ncbi:F4 (K88) fimbria minor subunit FaeF [Salmonella enterica]|nr:F4 (K88) fimbria minor subunit FaeF [Salmonella enterica]
MKKTMMAATLVLSTLCTQSALAAEHSEKTQYLGVVNGQVVGNSVVKVTRTPGDPVLYRSGDTIPLPDSLTIRNAESRAASGGMAYITVKQALPDNGEARITLKIALMVDGKKVALSARQQGEDVVITVPEAHRQVELRTDVPAELEVPVSYRGNLQIALQVED